MIITKALIARLSNLPPKHASSMAVIHYFEVCQSLCKKSFKQRQLWYQYTQINLFSPRRHFTGNSSPGDADEKVRDATFVENGIGPLTEYDLRVAAKHLRNDNFQRGIVQNLQRLHDELLTYELPKISRPTIKGPASPYLGLCKTISGILFPFRDPKVATTLPKHIPKGLYLFGDVGCGKTMLMDLFYETLPTKIASKSRLHFHNFMQDVHKRLHKIRLEYGSDVDGIPFVAAEIAEQGTVLCFDEFQCTDVADAMILRRLLETLMKHGIVLVTTSNRHPNDLYRNGIQRESFIPCIDLLKNHLHVINLDSGVDYRKVPRPTSHVYHTPLDNSAVSHAENLFKYLGDFDNDAPHSESRSVWGRKVLVPKVSGRTAMFTFDELIGRPMSAADYIELSKNYDAFIVTDIYGMTYQERDLARRFITFLDAIYEARSILILTSAVTFDQLFLSKEEVKERLISESDSKKNLKIAAEEVDDSMRNMMDDLGMNMEEVKKSSIFSGDEEKFAFSRALSRLSEMSSQEWVNRALIRMKKKDQNYLHSP
ncbi:Protein AFG1 [Erysiphe neolycopersici]|uniref:Protein AFG1 n=1 Tax=Erysiphe neolycopersici TaxID=212602 RepID=A0A420HYF4_9PEZI|nr:Protein AFG1 [Erysiphe neolycopersici]